MNGMFLAVEYLRLYLILYAGFLVLCLGLICFGIYKFISLRNKRKLLK